VSNSEKIEVSPDGKYAFFGGNGLHVLEIGSGEYKMIRHDAKKGNFFLYKIHFLINNRNKVQHSQNIERQ
jgi:hypothetical protein